MRQLRADGYHTVVPNDSHSRSPLAKLAARLEGSEFLDAGARSLAGILERLLPEDRSLLRGEFLGHPLHPLLTDVPIGTWTSSLLLDAAGGASAENAADLLLGVGLATAIPTALTGWVDWSEASVEQQRVGLVHAASNTAAVVLFGASLLARRTRRRRAGKQLSLLATGALGAGGYLGGHLAYAQAAGVGER